MYKTVFQNSKAALVFAGITIFGAVIMVGSPEDEGALTKTINRFSQQRETFVEDTRAFAEAQSVPDTVNDPSAGWGSSSPTVFGSYDAEAGQTSSGTANNGVAAYRSQDGQSDAILPGPQPVIADNVGIPVPRDDGVSQPPPVPVITSRKMTLEPN